jgi:very-short-patch-repair endonuclease
MSLLDYAKALRSNQTDAEQKLWYHLRAHRFMGRKFKRQKPVGRYVADFVCIEEKLIIELDGGQHAEDIEYDHERDSWLMSEGFMVLRFWNNELLNEMEGVLERIRLELIKDTLSPGPSPVNGRGED